MMELMRAGVKREIAQGAVREVYESNDNVAEAWKLAQKQAARLRKLDPQVARRRLAGMLARRGFDYDSIKPVIEVREGVVEPESRQRTRARALRYLVDKVRSEGNVEDLAVMHGEAPDVEAFLGMLSDLYPRDDIVLGDIGAVIGTHAGPRVIGMTFHTPR